MLLTEVRGVEQPPSEWEPTNTCSIWTARTTPAQPQLMSRKQCNFEVEWLLVKITVPNDIHWFIFDSSHPLPPVFDCTVYYGKAALDFQTLMPTRHTLTIDKLESWTSGWNGEGGEEGQKNSSQGDNGERVTAGWGLGWCTGADHTENQFQKDWREGGKTFEKFAKPRKRSFHGIIFEWCQGEKWKKWVV